MTDLNTVQCIPITIVSHSTSEPANECFNYTISTTSTDVSITLNPTMAIICISDETEGVHVFTHEITSLLSILVLS